MLSPLSRGTRQPRAASLHTSVTGLHWPGKLPVERITGSAVTGSKGDGSRCGWSTRHSRTGTWAEALGSELKLLGDGKDPCDAWTERAGDRKSVV